MLSGFAVEPTFMGEFLKKNGIEFENLRVREYKAALTRFSQDHMDDHNREQLQAYLDAAETAWVRDLAEGRNVSEEQARSWLDADFTSAQSMVDAGLLTRERRGQWAWFTLAPDRLALARQVLDA